MPNLPRSKSVNPLRRLYTTCRLTQLYVKNELKSACATVSACRLSDPLIALDADTEVSQLLLYPLFFTFLPLLLLTYLPEGSSNSLPFRLHCFLLNSNRLLLAPKFFLLSLVSRPLLGQGPACSRHGSLLLCNSRQFCIMPFSLINCCPFSLLCCGFSCL